MQSISGTLTVFFEDPFWVGVYERVSDGKLEVCKITFGAEPRDYEVYQYLLAHWRELVFSPPVQAAGRPSSAPANPKRMQRAIQKQVHAQGIGTRSQQALKLQHEENKAARQKRSRAQKEADQEHRLALRQQKKKDKHRGH